MPSATSLRLMSDLKAISSSPPEGCSASPTSDENLLIWNATVFGPDETAWEGGIFSLRITFCEGYPEKPPRIRFTSDMFHPNVYRYASSVRPKDSSSSGKLHYLALSVNCPCLLATPDWIVSDARQCNLDYTLCHGGRTCKGTFGLVWRHWFQNGAGSSCGCLFSSGHGSCLRNVPEVQVRCKWQLKLGRGGGGGRAYAPGLCLCSGLARCLTDSSSRLCLRRK